MWRIVRSRLGTGLVALLALILGRPFGALAAQHDSKGVSEDQETSQIIVRRPAIHPAPIQVDVDMVLLNVTVTDSFERVVTGLDASNFRVFDGKVEQEIVSFSTEDTPISVGLIFDSSGSMSDKIQKSREAVSQFFKTSNPQDELLLINFSERFKQVSGFTSRYENLQNSLLSVKAGGETALLDAIYLGLDEMRKASTNRKALLII